MLNSLFQVPLKMIVDTVFECLYVRLSLLGYVFHVVVRNIDFNYLYFIFKLFVQSVKSPKYNA